jgi:hypothetical protein
MVLKVRGGGLPGFRVQEENQTSTKVKGDNVDFFQKKHF